MAYIVLAFIKIVDNIISTTKNILVHMNKKFYSSVLVVISQLLFYTIIKEVISDSSIMTILIVAIASGVGNFLAFPIVDRFTKDDKWYFYLTSSDKEDVEILCRYLADHNIKYMANLGLTRDGEDTINITAFSKTKQESKLINEYLLASNSKYLKEIMK